MKYSNFVFGLINIDTLENLAKGKTLLPYKTIDGKKDERWNTKMITSKVMEGIINGKPVQNIADSFREVMDMNKASAIRNARTSITSCENSARMRCMEDAEKKGIKMKKQWMATHDSRTRESHMELDGQTVDIHDEFKVPSMAHGLMEPADPNGDPEEVYNCRCTMISVVDGVDPKLFNPNAYEE